MRRTLIGLVAAGLLAVTACGDDDSGGDDASASGGGSTEDFCAEFQKLDDRFSQDPEAAADMNQVLEALESLNPPEAISDDFNTVVDAARQTADVDLDDPQAVEEAQALSQEAAAAEARVATFLQDECGFGSTTDTTAPGSTDTTAG